MQKFVVLIVFLGLLSLPLMAQDYPKVEVFGGYSLLHIDSKGFGIDALVAGAPPGVVSVHHDFHGWNAAAQFNANKWFGITADLSGHSRNVVEAGGVGLKANSFSFLFGPTISYRSAHAKPFAHVLFGGNRLHNDALPIADIPEGSDTAFAMAFGGGLDVKVSHHFMIRAGQADYLYTKHDLSGGDPSIPKHQNNFRFSAGVVIAF